MLNLKTRLKNNSTIIILFIFFLTILFLSPINGDDWGNYLIGIRGLRGWIGNAIGMYFDWEGRFISRILINMLTYHKWLWNIFNALSITILFIITIKIINPNKNKSISLLLFLSFILIGKEIFTQTILWIAGNLTYFTPMVLILLYLYFIEKYLKNKKTIYHPLFIIISIITPMFVENMGVIIILINAAILLHLYIKDKKLNIIFLINLILSILFFLIMIKSPGTHIRTLGEAFYTNYPSVIDKIKYNIPNFFKYTISNNNIILLLTPLSFIFLTLKKVTNKLWKIILISINIIPYLTIINNIINLNVFNEILFFLNIKSKLNILNNNIFICIYYFLYLLIFFILIIRYFYNKNNKVIFIFIIGIISNAVMLLSPIWGARTTLFTVYMFIVTNLFIINERTNNKYLYKIVKILSIFISLIYIVLYINVYKQNNNREETIKKQLQNKVSIIEIERIPDYTLWGINPDSDYHIKTFKKYYKIPDDVNIIFKPIKYKYFIFYK